MARSTEWKTRVDVPAEKLLEVVTSPEWEVARAESDPGTVSAEVLNVSRDGDRLRFEIHTQEYGRSMTGAIQRGERVKTLTTVEWDLKAMRSNWRYRGHGGDKAEVTGGMHVVALGAGTSELVSVYNVKVNIPFIGGQAEKVVIRELDTGRGRFEETVRRFC